MHVCRHISKIHTTVLTFLFDYVDMMWSLTLREVSTRTYEPAAMMSHALRLRQRSLYGLSLVALTSLGKSKRQVYLQMACCYNTDRRP